MLPGAPSCGSKVFTYYVKIAQSFYVLRKTHPKVFTFHVKSGLRAVALAAAFAAGPAAAGWVERTPSNVVLNLTLFNLPDPSRTDPSTRAELAVQREFLRVAPDLLRARQAVAPGRYGGLDLARLDLRLHRFSGIQVEGVESTLLAIAGNVAPDVLYVNFRQSDT